jgi:hypothetical protein
VLRVEGNQSDEQPKNKMNTITDLLNKARNPMTLTVTGAHTASTRDSATARSARRMGATVERNIGRDTEGCRVNNYGWSIRVGNE